MKTSASNGKVLVIDPNVFFAKRLARALAEHGYEVVHCAEADYALTMVEYDMPAAILCSLSAKKSDGLEVPSILQSDAKTRHIPVIAVGDSRKHSHLDTLRAGYVELMDRRLDAEEMATHVSSMIVSLRQGFQPTQMLQTAETRLDGHLSLMDLPSVMQMLEQSRQTGALHVNSAAMDGIIFFDSGELVRAETGSEKGDQAVIHLVKECHRNREGTYKFVGGTPSGERTVTSPLTRLILDALYEVDDEKQKADVQAAASDPANGVTSGGVDIADHATSTSGDTDIAVHVGNTAADSETLAAPDESPADVLSRCFADIGLAQSEPPRSEEPVNLSQTSEVAELRSAPTPDTSEAGAAISIENTPNPGRDEPHE